MVLCYVGEPGGYGFYGRNRKVFYSNSGAHHIELLIEAGKAVVRADLENSANDPRVKSALLNPDLKERLREAAGVGSEVRIVETRW